MQYREIRDLSLQLLNQYSIAGAEIAPTYNNQQDYLSRIPGLVNDAMLYIATTAKRIPAVREINLRDGAAGGADVAHGMYEIPLPNDLYQMKPSGLLRLYQGRTERWTRFRRVGRRLYLPGDVKGIFLLEYYRYPERLEAEPAEDEELDGLVDAQAAVPYYVAAHLALHDDPTVRDALMDEFEARLSRLSEEQYMEAGVVTDVYGWGDQLAD